MHLLRWMHRQPWWSREVDGFLILSGYATTTRATTLRTLDVYFVFIHPREIAGAFAEIPQCSLICRCYLYFTYRSYLFSVLVLSMNCRALFQLLDSFIEGSQKGCSIPRSWQKLTLNPVLPTVYIGQSWSWSYNFVLVHSLEVSGPHRWVMAF